MRQDSQELRPLSSSCAIVGSTGSGLLLRTAHVKREVHNVAPIAKFIAIPVSEIDNMVTESHAGPSNKDGGIGITVKLTGNSVILCVGQDVLQGAARCLINTSLMSSYLSAFSRMQVRSMRDMLGVETQRPMRFPFSSGLTLPTTLVVSVLVGMMI